MSSKRPSWKIGCGGLLLLFLAIQFLPSGRLTRVDLLEPELDLPASLQNALRRNCFDCHSGVGAVPWYGQIAPMSWWVSYEVNRARATMDFSAWDNYSQRQRALIWRRSLERIRRGTMPPPRYTLAHSEVSSADYLALRDYVQMTPEWAQGSWTVAELTAWPQVAWKGEAITEVVSSGPKVLEERLRLEGGALLIEGDLLLEKGAVGEGALLVTGKLEIRNQDQSLGPVIAVGLKGVTISGSAEAQIIGSLVSEGSIELDGVSFQERSSLALEFDGVRQNLVEFCREDGEIGEPDERKIVVRYANGEFVLWEPEFQEVLRASSPQEALEAVATLMAKDGLTDIEVFNERFREGWVKLLSELPDRGHPARLTPYPLPLVYPLPQNDD